MGNVLFPEASIDLTISWTEIVGKYSSVCVCSDIQLPCKHTLAPLLLL